jgi:hypothetical protein
MKQVWAVVVVVVVMLIAFSIPSVSVYERVEEPEVTWGIPVGDPTLPTTTPTSKVKEFLESKSSPLAPHTELLLQQKHWKLLIAISAIESQYCKRQLGYNCWGIGGDSAYRHYESYEEAIVDANNLITRWQERGRWLTIDDMNCHYVVPCNDNWVRVVNTVLAQLEEL